MKHSAVRERGRETGPGDPCCVWRLGVTLWHNPSPWNLMVWPWWASGCYWPALLGQWSVMSQCPQWHDIHQNRQWPFFSWRCWDIRTKQVSRLLWISPELPPPLLSVSWTTLHLLPWLFLCSDHSTFLNILECSTWIHQALLYLDTSWSSFLEDPPPLWVANLFSYSRFQLNCIVFREVLLPVCISLLSWSLSVDPSSCLVCTNVTIHYVTESFLVHLPS